MESINTIKDIVELFMNTEIHTISENLKKIIHQTKMLNDTKNKKHLKQFYKLLVEYFIYKIEHNCLNNYLFKINEPLIDLAIMFQDYTNEFYQKLINEFENLERNEVLNVLVLTIYMTQNLNQTNQLVSNLLTNINKILGSLETNMEEKMEDYEYKVKLIRDVQILLFNIKSYNPFLINQIESVLNIFVESNKKKNETTLILLEAISDLLDVDDLNTDNTYRRIIDLLKHKKFNDDILAHKIIKTYHERALKLTSKKSIQINFLTIKRKPIQELEPEIDGEKRNMTKILEEKLKKTKKQAIRNLKKEARVIDAERQHVLKKIDNKRREELKASNQFIEQTNIEYKKLMTSQPKKRFKLKHNRK
jgi:hypothetical protein